MSVAHPESDEAVAERAKRLRKSLDFEKSSAFAAYLGVSPQRWSNVEVGLPLGRDLALKLVRKVPGLTLDWLYRGRPEGLPLELARQLGELERSPVRATSRPR